MTSISRRFVLPLTYEMFANDSFVLRRLVTTDMGAPSRYDIWHLDEQLTANDNLLVAPGSSAMQV
jgi:hypothetical protein